MHERPAHLKLNRHESSAVADRLQKRRDQNTVIVTIPNAIAQSNVRSLYRFNIGHVAHVFDVSFHPLVDRSRFAEPRLSRAVLDYLQGQIANHWMLTPNPNNIAHDLQGGAGAGGAAGDRIERMNGPPVS